MPSGQTLGYVQADKADLTKVRYFALNKFDVVNRCHKQADCWVTFACYVSFERRTALIQSEDIRRKRCGLPPISQI